MIPESDDPRRDAILNAAFECFVTYGFRRTSMEDIAVAAGLSRPTLYQRYKNKADIFRAFVTAMIDVVVADVRAAFDADVPIEDKLMDAVNKGFLNPHRELAATPHGAELSIVNKEIAGDLFARWLAEMEQAIADGLRRSAERHEIEPVRGGLDCIHLARVIVNGVEGAKMRMTSIDQAESDIRDMVRLIVAAEHA